MSDEVLKEILSDLEIDYESIVERFILDKDGHVDDARQHALDCLLETINEFKNLLEDGDDN